MAKYKVDISFTDSETKTVYRAGKDTYPKDGKTATEARIKALSTKDNRLNKPVISLIEEEKPKESEKKIEEVPEKEVKEVKEKPKTKAKK